MHILGVGRVKKKISLFLGDFQKKQFKKYVNSNTFIDTISNLKIKKSIDIELVTFVNSAGFFDLILSILSFINAAGFPKKWTLYVDDELTIVQKAILEKLPFVGIRRWYDGFSNPDKNRHLQKWQLRKFFAYGHHQLNGTTIFIDSDVLFYPLFNQYIADFTDCNWYLPEPPEANNIDSDLDGFFNFRKLMYTVNAGFFIINNTPDWSLGFQYLEYCIKNEKSHYFLDQSALNLMFYHDANARVLDPRVFHASAGDHFWISALNTKKFAIRHYVGLIRHKMWQLGWRKYLK